MLERSMNVTFQQQVVGGRAGGLAGIHSGRHDGEEYVKAASSGNIQTPPKASRRSPRLVPDIGPRGLRGVYVE